MRPEQRHNMSPLFDSWQSSMKFALVTDAWMPQVNGVVRTWMEVVDEMEELGHRVLVIHPGLFRSVAVPNYPEIRLAVFAGEKVASMLDDFRPDAIHAATEGPLGIACRTFCLERKLPFTTSYHTQYPQYLSIYYRVPVEITLACLRWFHHPAARTLVPTLSVARELRSKGFRNTVVWSRGVDAQLFRPREKRTLQRISRRFFPSTFPAAKWSSAMAPHEPIWSGGIHTLSGRVFNTARTWRASMPMPMSLCSPAEPTHSASRCSKPMPAGYPWPLIR
jgi:hypothetical protein